MVEVVYLGSTPVLALSGGQVYAIQADHLNAPRTLKNSSGAVVWRWQSDAFGVGQADSNPSGLFEFEFNLRFPGQLFDAETGLHYNNARYYDPATGRYISSDPIGLAGGINTYGYVGQAPASHVDETGAVAQIVIGAAVGFVIGAGISAVAKYQAGEALSWASVGSVLLAGAGGAAAGATGTWIGAISTRLGTAALLNGVVNSGVGLATGSLDNMLYCRPYETGAPRAFLINFALGAAGGVAGQALTNMARPLQNSINYGRAKSIAQGYRPPTVRVAPALNAFGLGAGNVISNSSPAVPAND